MNFDEDTTAQLPDKSEWQLADKWILSRLNTTIHEVTRLFDQFEFGEAGRALYNFIWNDLCDWYIEMAKEDFYGKDQSLKHNTQNILCYVLDQTLRLLHPIMPFVTEEIWLAMPHDGTSLVVAAYPEENEDFYDEAAEKGMENLIELIKAVRNIRADANAPLSSSVDILIKTATLETKKIFEDNQDYIERFCHPESLQIGADVNAPTLAMTAVISGAEVYIPLAGLVDLSQEVQRLQKEIDKLENEVARGEKKLSNQGFVNNAPEQLVAEEKEKLSGYREKLTATTVRLAEVKKEL